MTYTPRPHHGAAHRLIRDAIFIWIAWRLAAYFFWMAVFFFALPVLAVILAYSILTMDEHLREKILADGNILWTRIWHGLLPREFKVPTNPYRAPKPKRETVVQLPANLQRGYTTEQIRRHMNG